jgi:hypothetical protein
LLPFCDACLLLLAYSPWRLATLQTKNKCCNG